MKLSTAMSDDERSVEAALQKPAVPSGRRRRAAAFSYSHTTTKSAKARARRTLDLANGTTERDPRNGGAEGIWSSERARNDTEGRMEYTCLNEVPSECCCGLCGEVMEEPLQTQCCHKDYCQPCLKPSDVAPDINHTKKVISGVECPDCKAPNVKLKLNEELKKVVEVLHVKCVYASTGCVWEGKVSWLKDHVEKNGGCPYATVTCSNCDEDIRKKDAQNHSISQCRMRITKCQYCQMEDAYETITSHYQECPYYPIKCTLNCGETVARGKLQDHFNHECTSKGLQCPFRALGCAVFPIPTADMEKHVASCGVLHLVDMFQKFSSEIEELHSEVRDLRAENQSLRQEVETATAAVALTTESVDTLRRKSDAVNKTLLSELEYYYAAKQPTELIAVECIKTQLSSSLIHLQPGGSPATLRMSSYASHKESGQVWLSPPFYIHAGYKLRLGVHLNGVGAGKGSHMSVYLHLMAGERDDQLDWPYLIKDHVRVSLLMQTEYQTSSNVSPTMGRVPPRFFGQKGPSSSEGTLTLSLPPNASPIRQRRKLMEDQRTPPKDKETLLVAVETQPMSITSYLRRVNVEQNALAGQVISKVDLFCTQSRVQEAVYRDSLVFQCLLCSSNLTDGCLTCS